MSIRKSPSAFIALTAVLLTSTAIAQERSIHFEISQKPLAQALRDYGQISGQQIIFTEDLVAGVTTAELRGNYTPGVAIDRLLKGTGLTAERSTSGTLMIRRAAATVTPTTASAKPNTYRLAQADGSQPVVSAKAGAQAAKSDEEAELDEVTVHIPEVLVKGSKVLNMDIARTRDDAQPYVIFDRQTIERSGANSLNEFFKQHLPMNTSSIELSQVAGSELGNRSRIRLRGLGANQTLILVDGHRVVPTPGSTNIDSQADINGIPIAAVERIEILPTTASGLYGGSATGGVINIILRRDYSGIETRLGYDNTFDTNSAVRRVDLNGGFTLEGGKTNVLLAGSYSDADPLLNGQRDLIQRARETIFANNPNYYVSSGNPPLGATTNIRSADGSPLFGTGTASFTTVPAGYAGGGGLAPLAQNAGTYNFDLANSLQDQGARAPLLNSPTVESLQLTLRRQFSSRVQGFLEAAGSRNSSRSPISQVGSSYTVQDTAPNNPFGKNIIVTVPTSAADSEIVSESENRRLVGGVIVALPADWKAETDFTWNQSRFEYSKRGDLSGALGAAVRNGTLDVLRDTNTYPLDLSPYSQAAQLHTIAPYHATLKDTTLRVSGPTASLPAGRLTVATLLEHREEIYGAGAVFSPPGIVLSLPERSQSIDSAYLETRLPIVSAANRLPGIRELDMQLSVRRDDYTINGTNSFLLPTTPVRRTRSSLSSTDFTAGLRYQPIPSLMLRASYGTGFLPPSVSQIVSNPAFPNDDCGTVIDPRRGNEVAPFLCGASNGNPNLKPEKSKSWSAGLVLTPTPVPDLRLSVDYTRIDKTDNIAMLGFQQLVDNESAFSGIVERAAPAPGDPFQVGRITTLNTLFVNISKALVEAYDLALDYRWQTSRRGTFDLFALATRNVHYRTQTVPGAPVIENVGLYGFDSISLKLRANAGVVWTYGNWTSSWTTRYFDSYLIADPTLPSSAVTILNQGNGGRIPSQVYHDVLVGYQFGNAAGAWSSRLLSNTELNLGVKNIFNKEPPFSQSGFYSQLGDPRLAAYSLSLRKSF